jgi:hypothetical protein
MNYGYNWIKELVNSASDKYELANLLKESLLEIFDAQGVSLTGFLGDLLDYAITQIEFHELAGEYWDEYRTKDEERDENEDNLSIPTI